MPKCCYCVLCSRQSSVLSYILDSSILNSKKSTLRIAEYDLLHNHHTVASWLLVSGQPNYSASFALHPTRHGARAYVGSFISKHQRQQTRDATLLLPFFPFALHDFSKRWRISVAWYSSYTGLLLFVQCAIFKPWRMKSSSSCKMHCGSCKSLSAKWKGRSID